MPNASGNENRYLGIDLGDRRIGLSTATDESIFVRTLETVTVQGGMKGSVDVIAAVCEREQATVVVLGLPLNMDGSVGARAAKVQEFAERLQVRLPRLQIEFIDERLTTVLAHQTMISQGKKPSRNKELVDQEAARRILQDYLDREANRRRREEAGD
jgi:putative Holliday junction resolvase